jgi:sulfonate transport system substrate-binding protein
MHVRDQKLPGGARGACFATLLAIAGCDSGSQAAQYKAPPARAELVVHLGYQKTGVPFLLKQRADGLRARLAARGARAEWVEFQAGPALLEAMRGGGVDIGYTGEAPPIFAQSGGVPFVYVACDPPSPEAEAILVRANSSLREVADLKGKRIALNRGSNVHYLLLRALEAAALSIDDVQLVYLAPADARSAFEHGSVDAWVIWDPFLAAAERQGARVLRNGEHLVDNRPYYLARREFAQTHADLLELVLHEYSSQSTWASTHLEEASRLLAGASGIAFETLLLSERRHAYGVQPITDSILDKQQAIADAFVKLRIIPRAVDTHQAVLSATGSLRSLASQP